MRKIRILPLAIFCGSLNAAEVIESWECQENSWGNWTTILVRAEVNSGRASGKIHVAGVVHDTIFQIKGFERRWDFGLSGEGTYKYAFVVKPNGSASYYDFNYESQTGPSMMLHCRQK